jgi:hypothetical protein
MSEFNKLYKTFYGIVEDRNDPLFLGRCRVRIMGLHNFNKNEVPTESLPWAMTNNLPNSISVPKENEWVTLSLIDGDTNYPVITGIIPGIILIESEYPENSPTWPNGTEQQTIDQPNVSRLSRGDISRTPIEVSNNNKAHVCDVTYSMRLTALQNNVYIQSAIKAVRDKITSLINSTSAFLQSLEVIFKQINAILREISSYLEVINGVLLEIAEVTKLLRQLVVWILSLPARLIGFLQECLTNFLSAIGNFASGIFGQVTSGVPGFSTVNEFVETVKLSSKVIENTKTTFSTAAQITTDVVIVKETFEKA